jgi:ABC-type transport system involved in multi-copper enzyme maturation permease subunit
MSLWLRQIGGVFSLEWKKTFLSKRGWWIYFLALAPMALTFLHWMLEGRPGRHNNGHSIGDDVVAFAAMFQFFYLRGAIFFGCVGVFCNLFRAEMLEKTLHYYYLTPVRREILVAGKYLAGLAMALVIFVGSVTASFFMIGRHAGQAWSNYIWHGPGLSQIEWYVVVTILACIGYGAVFLTAGILFRNPMIPAAVVFVWENLTPFLPSVLKKISVIFYLRNLCPVEVPVPPPFNVMVIDADPTPAWLAIFGLMLLSLTVLAYSAISAKQTEISYGE